MTSKTRHLFTSESVTEGHPDKVCDQISDALLDAFLAEDPSARVAIETACTTGLVLVFGEVTAKCYVDIPHVVRKTIEEIGYKGSKYGHAGFDAHTCSVISSIDEQSPDISQGVTEALEVRGDNKNDEYEQTGAGDQGLMFGYACNETVDYLPLPISLAQQLAKKLSDVRKEGVLSYLRPDGKTQVSVEYENGKPVAIDTIVISTQHGAEVKGETDNTKIQEIIYNDLLNLVIKPVFENHTIKPTEKTRYLINPSGRFVIGGPQGDAGLTGRKIIVDTYGGYARHGGGAFSGKDPTKVDRSAAYAARYVAKNIVAAGLATHCEVQVSYAIGVARPVSVCVNTFGTGVISDEALSQIIDKEFDLRPEAIITQFELRQLPSKNGGTFYRNVAAYGHFGRPELNLPWEKLDKVEKLKCYANNKELAAV